MTSPAVHTVAPQRVPRFSRSVRGAGVLGAVASTAGVALTATSGWLIVRASEQPVILTLLTAIVAVRAFGLARPAFRYAERLVSHDVALAELAKERTRVFALLIPLTPARLSRRGRAAMLTGVVDDLDDAVAAQTRVTVPLTAAALTSMATIAFCLLIDLLVGMVMIGLVAAMAGCWWIAVRGERVSQHELGQARQTVTTVAELVAGRASELQAIGAQADAAGWLADAHRTLGAAIARQSRGRAFAAAALPVTTALATIVIAAVVAGGSLPAPVAALLVLVPVAIGDVLGGLPDAARAQARAVQSRRRVDDLLNLRPAVGVGGDEILNVDNVPRLQWQHITASWDDHRDALPPIDLDVPPGAVQVISGPSGSGKSTLVAVLARHLEPTAGTYLIDGQNVADLLIDGVRRLFAIVDDEPHVFAASLRDNLLLARPAATDDELVDAVTAAGLRPWLAELPAGLDTRLGTGGRGISGGERSRLAIARALLSQRPVLLLDEPVAHLDHPTAIAVLGDLIKARGRRTVIVVSHSRGGLAAADGMMSEVRLGNWMRTDATQDDRQTR